jgi:cell division protein FtsL
MDNEKEKIQKYHNDADEGKKQALRRERNLSIGLIVIVLFLIALLCILAYAGISLIKGTSY